MKKMKIPQEELKKLRPLTKEEKERVRNDIARMVDGILK